MMDTERLDEALEQPINKPAYWPSETIEDYDERLREWLLARDVERDAARAYRNLVANGERVASYRDTDGFVKLHGSTMLDERGPGVDYLVVPVDRNLDSGGQTQVSEPKLANGERVEWCETHNAESVQNHHGMSDECWRLVWVDNGEPEGVDYPYDVCRIVSRLLVDPPKEETS